MLVLKTSIDNNGHINWLTTSKSANYTMVPTDDLCFVTATCTISLPAAPATGKPYAIKAYGAAVTVTVSGNGKNIDGVSTFSLFPYDSATFIYNGTEYSIF